MGVEGPDADSHPRRESEPGGPFLRESSNGDIARVRLYIEMASKALQKRIKAHQKLFRGKPAE
jgi:hypothetical protein